MLKLVCFHLYNDYSGSPKVLKMILQALLSKGYKVDLITSRGGTLDDLSAYTNLKSSAYTYKFSSNSLITMMRFFVIQLYTFILSFRYIFQKDAVFYINTLLPVGPALAGRIMRKRVIYHYHENAFAKGAFYMTLCRCMEYLASDIICVSAHQHSFLSRKEKVCIIPNAVPKAFVERLNPNIDAAFNRKKVLMLGSLKLYKGTLEFIQLAERLPKYVLELVVNDTQDNIDRFLVEHQIEVLPNLKIYPRQNDVVPFYNNASIVLNMSHPQLFIETFGLTALEAMSAGLPIIVPTVGGIAEMVDDGVNGYKIDVQNIDIIVERIQQILSDKTLYSKLANNALAHSQKYNVDTMVNAIVSHLA